MTNFQVEAGLPPYGPPALSFPDQAAFQEGLVVSFMTSTGDRWTGNFARGFGSMNTVRDELGPHAIVVVSGSCAYLVNIDRRMADWITEPVKHIEYVPSKKLIVVGNGFRFDGIAPSGEAWRTRRISWDGMRSLQIENGKIVGEAFSPLGPPDWMPFEVDLASGHVEGGSYNGPP